MAKMAIFLKHESDWTQKENSENNNNKEKV